MDAYKANSEDDEAVKTKLSAERDTYKNLVELLTNQTVEYKAALADQKLATASADQRASNAEKEVMHQKKRVKRAETVGKIKSAGSFVLGLFIGNALPKLF